MRGIFFALALVGALSYLWLSGRLRKSEAGPRIKTVAILPFKLIGTIEGDEYLGVGMAER